MSYSDTLHHNIKLQNILSKDLFYFGGYTLPGEFSIFLVAQSVKNPPEMQETACNVETQVQSLGWEDPLEKVEATPLPCLGNPMERGGWQTSVHGVAKSRT